MKLIPIKDMLERRVRCRNCAWSGKLKRANSVEKREELENWIKKEFRWTCPRCDSMVWLRGEYIPK